MGGPVILVFGAVSHQLLVNDMRQKKQPPRVQIPFPLQEAPNMLRSIEQELHMGSYRLQYAQLCVFLIVNAGTVTKGYTLTVNLSRN